MKNLILYPDLLPDYPNSPWNPTCHRKHKAKLWRLSLSTGTLMFKMTIEKTFLDQVNLHVVEDMKQKNWRPREEEKLPTWIKLAVQQERKRRGGDEQEDKRTSYEGFVALYERSLPINGLQRKQEWENFDQMGKVGRCLYGHHHKLPTLLILNSLKHQKQQIFLKYFLKECQLYQNYRVIQQIVIFL